MQYKLTVSVFLMSYYISIILGTEMCMCLQFGLVLIYVINSAAMLLLAQA